MTPEAEEQKLWKQFLRELDEIPVTNWEFYAHRCGFSRMMLTHHNQLYKLMLRPAGGKKEWWWFEEEIYHRPSDYERDCGEPPAWMRLTGCALLLEFLDAQKGVPGDKPAMARAIAEVRCRIAALPDR